MFLCVRRVCGADPNLLQACIVVLLIGFTYIVVDYILISPTAVGAVPTLASNTRSHSSFASAPSSTLKMAACTVVRNDAPYLPEWVEYYRIQGFSKFWILNDKSTDNVELLQKVYDRKFPGEGVVEVHTHTTPGKQDSAFAKCHQRALAGEYDWVAVMDTDEFWWSPKYNTIADYVRAEISPDKSIGSIRVSQYRYGTNGQVDRFRYVLVEEFGIAKLKTDARHVELMTELHLNRGPYTVFGEPAALIDNSTANCSTPASDGWHMCMTDIVDGKSMWRPNAVQSDIFVHYPRHMREGFRVVHADPLVLRGNHYYYRSQADAVKKSQDWHKPDPVEGVQRVDSYWNSVRDMGILRNTKELTRRIKSLLYDEESDHVAHGW